MFVCLGLQHLVKVVKAVVAKPVSPRTLQEPLSIRDLKKIVYEVRRLMEAGSAMNGFVHARNYHLEFLIPERQAEPVLDSMEEQQLFMLNELVNKALERCAVVKLPRCSCNIASVNYFSV